MPENDEDEDLDSLDARIARLEAELARDLGEESSDETSSSSGGSPSGEKGGEGVVERDGKLISSLLADHSARIEPLPRNLLPEPGCGVSSSSKRDESPGKERKRAMESGASGVRTKSKRRGLGKGLEAAVRDLQCNYEARSAERVKYYCRACKFQGSSLEDLESHRQTQEHHKMADIERKASYCRMCRKQFTSPPQLHEHVKGKAHTLKLESYRRRQQGRR